MFAKVGFAVLAIAFLLCESSAFDMPAGIPGMDQAAGMASQGANAAGSAAKTMANLPGVSSIPGASEMANQASNAAQGAIGMMPVPQN
ncbi:hypothetical protein HHI36_022140 [Cryptolaemus montrouzieri]|uniref:Uncharacterized protein n=1 Tax=Cryptolaemus montrouzieri TaxID=559131 RepID=A0ABD2MZ53_9CUCU